MPSACFDGEFLFALSTVEEGESISPREHKAVSSGCGREAGKQAQCRRTVQALSRVGGPGRPPGRITAEGVVGGAGTTWAWEG